MFNVQLTRSGAFYPLTENIFFSSVLCNINIASSRGREGEIFHAFQTENIIFSCAAVPVAAPTDLRSVERC